MTDPKASNPASTPRPAPQPQPPQTTASSIKETIESILIAFILAFIFRSFVVEAFIIPTGSMAPTLLGAHMRFQCPDCGYRFTTNYSSRSPRGGDDNAPPRRALGRYTIHCPNCGYELPDRDPTEPAASATNPPVHYGDRILVLKYQYLLHPPQRWDVVVFKSPADAPPKDDPPRKDPPPDAPFYNQNYIKRLVGEPGETVMILDGDIYVRREGQSGFEVQTKPHAAQEALWRIVYDNDYYPLGKPRGLRSSWEQPWEPSDGAGWQPDGRTFRFANAEGSGALRFDADANPSKYALTDWLAYDVTEQRGGWRPHYVSDLKLALSYQRQAGAGPLDLKLSKRGDLFTTRVLPGQVQLLHQKPDAAEPVLLGSSPLENTAAAQPLRIEMANVDYQVTVRVDGREVLRTTPQQYAPDYEALLEDYRFGQRPPPPSVEIVAADQSSQLSHISLWRDVYYLNIGGDWWGTPAKPMVLGKDEFFVLGDNSFISEDARYWKKSINLPSEDLYAQAGRVPGRFLLGKAFFVYWPAGFRPFSEDGIGIIPNFGDMRFIH